MTITTMRRIVGWCCLSLCMATIPHRSWTPRWGMVPRGGASSLQDVKQTVLQNAWREIDALRQTIVDQGQLVEDFGEKADAICNKALEQFAVQAPAATDADSGSLYDKTLSEIESSLDSPLHVLYLKQLGYLREQGLQSFRSTSSDYESMLSVDNQFVRAAEASTREGSDWDYTSERAFLQAVMNLTAESSNKSKEAQVNAAQQQQTAMSFLQSQQQMIQQLQMQLYGQTSPWNVGVAYRIPDTNFNLQGSYQQGRANVQLSCVPDEYAPFLGPNGFTNGVGPGNLGLSLNLSI